MMNPAKIRLLLGKVSLKLPPWSTRIFVWKMEFTLSNCWMRIRMAGVLRLAIILLLIGTF